jgi:DNA repair protein RecN (Recombination protein N)
MNMLQELRIRNFVLIEELNLVFGKGLNILTGETGAGKSILIDAISGVLGEKMSTSVIRGGCERAVLEAVFDISYLPQVQRLLEDAGIDSDGDELLIRRELFASGKGRCFLNAVQVPVAKVKEISDYLLDIHGQGEHQNIAQVARHREMLDSYAGHGGPVERIGALYNELHSIKEAIESRNMDEREKARRIEYLSFAVNEIDAAKLRPNEEEELREEANLLSHAERLFNESRGAGDALKADGGVLSGLKRVEKALAVISDIDANMAATLESAREAYYRLEDVVAELRDYERQVHFSPERANEVEERLALISSLRKKYGDTIAQVLQYAEKSRQELDSISSSDEQIEKLKERYRGKVKEARDVALALSASRQSAAKTLEEKVMGELNDLNMKGTTFKVSVTQEASATGEIEHESRVYMLYPTGLDRVEFLLAANKGEDLQQLRKVASGGEMSRIMLAYEKVILDNDIVGTLIFDEVDTGISGKTAEIVGKKLKGLAASRQVLVITHLPQIAAMSDVHFNVQKTVSSDRTFTTVKTLSKQEKMPKSPACWRVRRLPIFQCSMPVRWWPWPIILITRRNPRPAVRQRD